MNQAGPKGFKKAVSLKESASNVLYRRSIFEILCQLLSTTNVRVNLGDIACFENSSSPQSNLRRHTLTIRVNNGLLPSQVHISHFVFHYLSNCSSPKE